jgi:hypothetical protein
VRTVDSGDHAKPSRRAAAPPRGSRLTSLRDLPERIGALPEPIRRRVENVFEIRIAHGSVTTSASLEPWLAETFGSADAVRDQIIVRVTNRLTLEATLFAPLRSRRPVDGKRGVTDLAAEIEASRGDPFCTPESGTPEEPIGRVRGRHMITGANAAMAEAHHAVLVFDEHDPLAFDEALVIDLLETGRRWAERSREGDPEATNYVLLWNCLWRAGGSIIHGHAQALLGGGAHVARLDRLRRDTLAHRAAHPDGDLVEEVLAAHRALGLTIEAADGVTVVAHLTPTKEREVLVVGTAGSDETDAPFADAVARTVVAYRDRLGVRSFNLVVWRPPLTDSLRDGWDLVPPIVRLVDRGDPASRPSDIGAMELYATPIVGGDPYEVIEALR